MAGPDRVESPLEAAAGAAGAHATEAFEVLANETRLAILLALWDAYEPHASDNAVSFSELRGRVGLRDSGQFNYHLGKLEERFLEKVDDGYELRRNGLLLVQSIIAGTGFDEPVLEPTEIDASCDHCGAPTAITYDNVYVYQVCTECDGGDFGSEHPRGALTAWTFEPTGLADRTAEEIFTASTVKNLGRIGLRFEEICPDCSGPVEWSLDVCEDHHVPADGACSNCERADLAVVQETCTVCKSAGHGPPGIKVLLHPAVISFLYDHGIEVGFTGHTTFADIVRTLELVEAFEETLVSTEPLRLRVTVPCGGDELHLTLDASMDVVEIEESP